MNQHMQNEFIPDKAVLISESYDFCELTRCYWKCQLCLKALETQVISSSSSIHQRLKIQNALTYVTVNTMKCSQINGPKHLRERMCACPCK